LTGFVTYVRRLALPALMPLVLLLVSATAVAVFGQHHAGNSLSVDDGLPQGFVSGIVQDNEGFIWIGTRDGLARYDGTRFKTFRFTNDTFPGISSNVILNLYHDPRNRIWVFHESGAIDCLDPRRERFTHFTEDPAFRKVYNNFGPSGMYVDSRDNLWLPNTGKGLWRCDVRGRKATLLTRATHGLLSDTVRGVVEDRAKRYWVFSNRGIQILDANNRIVKTKLYDFTVTDSDFKRAVYPQFSFGLRLRNDREIMIREWKRVLILDMETLQLQEYKANLPYYVYDVSGNNPQVTPDGTEYIEMLGEIYRFAPQHPLYKVWRGAPDSITTFLIDRSGVMWIGTNDTGVRTADMNTTPFHSEPYHYGFFRDMVRDEMLVPESEMAWMSYSARHRFEFDIEMRFAYDQHEQLWMTDGNNLVRYDPFQRRATLLPGIPDAGACPDARYGPLAVDKQNVVWRMHMATGNPVYWNERQHRWVFPLGKGWTFPAKVRVQNIVKTGKAIWASTEHHGLFSVSIDSGYVRQYESRPGFYSLPTNELLDIVLDPEDTTILWIGSHNGLARFDTKTGRCRTFNVADGLPNNTVYCVQPDSHGFLWLSTNSGICRFDRIKSVARSFSRADGLQSNEFNRFHKLRLPDNRIALGGIEGWTIFDPKHIQEDVFKPTVAITGLKINNEPVEFQAGRGVLTEPLNATHRLTLKPDQNFLTFEFSALQFNDAKKLTYRYRLKGFDDDWVYANNLGLANYTKISPGRYTFEVNAANTSGAWSPEIKSIHLVIEQPMWRTNWAFIAYALILAAMLSGYIRYRRGQAHLHELVEMKHKEAGHLRELDDVKNRFFSNITHEFRTPLTLILSPVEQMLKAPGVTEEQRRELTLVQQNAGQLLGLVNQLMDLSRLEAGVMRVTEFRGAPDQVIQSIVDVFRPVAERQHKHLVFRNMLPPGDYWLDKEKLERIVNNLLGNAFKFTNAEDSIVVVLKKDGMTAAGDTVSITVSDTGIGIEKEKQAHIFNRFYQVDTGTSIKQGSGIGLAMVKELAGLLGGDVRVDSHPREGATFVVTLPLKRIPAEPVMEASGYEAVPVAEAPLILIVEDNDAMRGFLARHLNNNARILQAVNGREAWRIVLEEMPDLVVCDVMMPYLDGIGFCRLLRETEATQHIPLVMLTAKTTEEDKIEGLNVGANDYITKPFRMEELQSRITNLLDHQRRMREFYYRRLMRQEPVASVETVAQEVAQPQNALETVFLNRVYAVIQKELDNTNLTVTTLADNLGMSTRTLNRKLTTVAGVSAVELLRNYRLKAGAELLQQGYPVAEVAYQVGFESPSYFGQCFKELFGVVPSEYKTSLSPNSSRQRLR